MEHRSKLGISGIELSGNLDYINSSSSSSVLKTGFLEHFAKSPGKNAGLVPLLIKFHSCSLRYY